VAFDVKLLELLPMAIYVTDAEGRITYYNQAAADLWGCRPELNNDKWCGSWRLYWPDGRPLPHDECPMAVTLKTGQPVRGVEAVAERPDGTRISFVPYPTPLLDDSGRLAGAINLLVDTTERNRAELDLLRLAAIVSSSDDAIISKTLEGKITSWNTGATRIFGYQPDEMIGQSILKIIPTDLHDEEADILAKLRSGERVDHYETVRITKDRQHINVSLTVSPLRDRFGRIVGASKVARDITERKRAEKSQHLLIDELNHRVRNTLAVVQSIAAQTLSRSTRPADFVASFSARIQALARVHTLLAESSWRGADLLELIRGELDVGLASRVSYSGPSVMLDPRVASHLGMVLHELATNARKYGALSVAEGSIIIRWNVRAAEERTLVLQWKEKGSPNVRAPRKRGFGTTLIEESVKAHGGHAAIQYLKDGIICSITLPLPEQTGTPWTPTDALQTRIDTRGVSASRADLTGKRILVVEDEPLISMELSGILTDAGCEVVGPAGTLENASHLIETERFDAALLDVSLAGRMVDDLAVALTRQNHPFAFVTGYGREELPPAFKEGLVVAKPFNDEQLLMTVRRLIFPGPSVVSLREKSS
jgi:PAS domain S-box-containing protein